MKEVPSDKIIWTECEGSLTPGSVSVAVVRRCQMCDAMFHPSLGVIPPHSRADVEEMIKAGAFD